MFDHFLTSLVLPVLEIHYKHYVPNLKILTWKGTGCTGGLGHGELLPNGLSSGAGHGGRGGDAYYEGTYIRGGIAYGDAELPCELGSGSGNLSRPGATAGGGVIGEFLLSFCLV